MGFVFYSGSGFWQAAPGKHLLSEYTEKHLSAEPLSTNTGAVIWGLGAPLLLSEEKQEHRLKAQEGYNSALTSDRRYG